MRGDVAERPAARVRAAIARLWLRDDAGRGRPPASRAGGERDAATRTLGAITLRSHQADAARRLACALDDFGGALLADEVGLGKTYTALAVARSASRPLVVAPAALRDMWRAALEATGVRAPIVTFERLSRSGDALPRAARGAPFDLVVVDEAHHARNPATRRYRALARLAEHARVLLISATPIHNRRADLDALLALFVGGRSRTLDDRDLAHIIVRRGPSMVGTRDGEDAALVPAIAPLRWLRPPTDDSVLDALLSLPPPLPPRDGGDGGALVVHGLVRQWASSDAALRAAVARRLAVCAALADALARGRHPTRADLRAWVAGADAVQLAFAELLVESAPLARGDELLAAVGEHERALHELDARLRASDAAADDARASLLAGVVAGHPGEKVVAFASYAETVTALFRRLRHAARVAALTGGGAVVAGGRITRREALARFAPIASGAPPPREAERVELLLATDLLSEGVNLQDASVVVHLDLPWTEARLAQRVGRAARIGARHREVAVYALAPPATAERILEVEARLREKARVAGIAIGPLTGPSLPGVSSDSVRSGPGDAERTREVMRAWLDGDDDRPGRDEHAAPLDGPLVVAAVRAPHDGFLALCALDAPRAECSARSDVAGEDAPAIRRRLALVASLGGAAPSDAPATVHDAVALAAGDDVPVDRARSRDALAALEAWAAARAASCDAGVGATGGVAARRRVLDRVAAIARRAPHHRRAAIAIRCRDARRAALLPLGAAAEWRLDTLARSALPDDAWLEAVAAFASTHDRVATDADRSPSPGVRPLAILHFVADL